MAQDSSHEAQQPSRHGLSTSTSLSGRAWGGSDVLGRTTMDAIETVARHTQRLTDPRRALVITPPPRPRLVLAPRMGGARLATKEEGGERRR